MLEKNQTTLEVVRYIKMGFKTLVGPKKHLSQIKSSVTLRQSDCTRQYNHHLNFFFWLQELNQIFL